MSMSRAEQLVQAGIAAARTGDTARARSLLRNSIDLDPKRIDAWVWLSGVAENPGEAVSALERALRLDPQNRPARAAINVARFEAGVAAAKANRREEACRWLTQFCAEEPASESAWLWLASVTDDPKQAIEHLQRALKLNPANERARAGIERLRANTGENVRWGCPICLAEAVERFTTCPQCRAVLDLAQGDAALANRNPDVPKIRGGIARLADAVRRESSFVNRYYLGMALLNLGKPDEAIGHFRAARTLRPNDAGLAAQVDLLQRALAESAPPTKRILPQVETPTAESNKAILVVDESPTIRKLAGMTLRKNGYTVVEAQDGQEAWLLIEAGVKPDLVLTDVKLPRMDGHALCRAIRGRSNTAKVPVVVMTYDDDVADRVAGRKAGVDTHLSKPFHPTVLANAVRDLCPAVH